MSEITIHPKINSWYECQNFENSFKVIALDEQADYIEIQLFSGEIEELELEDWHDLSPTEIDEPSDWPDNYENNIYHSLKIEDWNNTISYRDSSEFDWNDQEFG